MNAITLEVSVSVIAGFAADGRVYRTFLHLIASRPGEMLLVPLGRSGGDLRSVIDTCPVPWAEVWAVLDTPPQDPAHVPAETMCSEFPHLALITPYGWERDAITLPPHAPAARKIPRLRHVSGVRFVKVGAGETAEVRP